jgi:hypothetical protein
MTNSNRFATVPIYADSLGNEVVPSNAISVGTIDPVAECEARSRALDERERELNEQKHQLIEWDAALHEERCRMDATSAARRDAIKHGLLADVLSKLDGLVARMDAYEEEQRANDPELQISLPPGITADEVGDLPTSTTDEGELQASKEPLHQYQDPDPEPVEPEPPDVPELIEDSDGDPGAVLPQVPLQPSNKYYDPHPSPETNLNLPTLVEDQ